MAAKLTQPLLSLLGICVSLGVLLTIVSHMHDGSPDFGQSILGFGATMGFWISVVRTVKALVNLFRSP